MCYSLPIIAAKGCLSKGAPTIITAIASSRKERLVGIAIWESNDHFERSIDVAQEAIKDDPHDEWEDNPPEIFELEEA